MKKKILILLLVLIVLIGGGYAALYMNPEGGMGFLGKLSPINSKIEKPVSNKTIDASRITTANQLSLQNQYQIQNKIQAPEELFEQSTPKPIHLELSSDFSNNLLSSNFLDYQVKLYGGAWLSQPTHENVFISIAMCDTKLCNLSITDSRGTNSEKLEPDKFYIGGNGGTNFMIKLIEIIDSKTAIIRPSKVVQPESESLTRPLEFSLFSNDPSTPIKLAELGIGKEATIKLTSCTQTPTLKCSFSFTDRFVNTGITEKEINEFFFLQGEGTNIYKVTLINGKIDTTGNSSAVIQIAKRG
jgi:hypothetical protein